MKTGQSVKILPGSVDVRKGDADVILSDRETPSDGAVSTDVTTGEVGHLGGNPKGLDSGYDGGKHVQEEGTAQEVELAVRSAFLAHLEVKYGKLHVARLWRQTKVDKKSGWLQVYHDTVLPGYGVVALEVFPESAPVLPDLPPTKWKRPYPGTAKITKRLRATPKVLFRPRPPEDAPGSVYVKGRAVSVPPGNSSEALFGDGDGWGEEQKRVIQERSKAFQMEKALFEAKPDFFYKGRKHRKVPNEPPPVPQLARLGLKQLEWRYSRVHRLRKLKKQSDRECEYAPGGGWFERRIAAVAQSRISFVVDRREEWEREPGSKTVVEPVEAVGLVVRQVGDSSFGSNGGVEYAVEMGGVEGPSKELKPGALGEQRHVENGPTETAAGFGGCESPGKAGGVEKGKEADFRWSAANQRNNPSTESRNPGVPSKVRERLSRTFRVLALRVPEAEVEQLAERLEGHLLHWPRISNIWPDLSNGPGLPPVRPDESGFGHSDAVGHTVDTSEKVPTSVSVKRHEGEDASEDVRTAQGVNTFRGVNTPNFMTPREWREASLRGSAEVPSQQLTPAGQSGQRRAPKLNTGVNLSMFGEVETDLGSAPAGSKAPASSSSLERLGSPATSSSLTRPEGAASSSLVLGSGPVTDTTSPASSSLVSASGFVIDGTSPASSSVTKTPPPTECLQPLLSRSDTAVQLGTNGNGGRTISVTPRGAPTCLLLLDEALAGRAVRYLPKSLRVLMGTCPPEGALGKTEGAALLACGLTLDYQYWSKDEALGYLVSSGGAKVHVEYVGHVALLYEGGEDLDRLRTIGQVLIDKNPHVRTVLTHPDGPSDRPQLVAGAPTFFATTLENGVRLEMDFGAVGYDPSMTSERQRLLDTFTPADVICDAFAGIGALAVAAARRVRFVHAAAPNPVALCYLARNAELNGARNVRLWQLEPDEFLRDIHGANPQCYVTQFVLDLTSRSCEVLAAFRGSFDRGRWGGRPLPQVHVYTVAETDDPEAEITEKIATVLGTRPKAIRFHHVKAAGDRRVIIAATFRLPHECAFDDILGYE